MRAAEPLFLVIAAAGVLALGASRYWAFLPLEAAIVTVAAFTFYRAGFPRLSPLVWAGLALLLSLPLLQLIPLPRAWIAVLSPTRVVLQDLVSAFDSAGAVRLTMNPVATQIALLRLISCAGAFLLAYKLSSEERPTRLAIGLTVLGVFEGGYALLQYLGEWQSIFGYPRPPSTTEFASGTYIDRNHYAGLLSMVLPFIFAAVLEGLNHRGSAAAWKETARPVRSVRGDRGPLLLAAVVFLVLVLGLVFSHSRMGIVSALVGLLVVAVVMLSRQTQLSLLLAIMILPVAYAAWIGVGSLVERFEKLAAPDYIAEELRPKIWRETSRVIRDFPVFGVGLGAVSFAIPHYQSETLPWTIDYAHNDYLQFAAEVGIPASLLLFAALWFVAIRALVWGRRAFGPPKLLAAGCSGALIAILVHSFTEFNLQLAANALIFSWISGVAAGLPAGAARRIRSPGA